jgi:hypothetical protein
MEVRMKLSTQISVFVVLGLAIDGLTRNGMELGRLYRNRCQCCGNTAAPDSAVERSVTSFQNAGQVMTTSLLVPVHENRPRTAPPPSIAPLPEPVGQASAGDEDPVVRQILEIRRQLGGGGVASILGSSPIPGVPETDDAELFRETIEQYSSSHGFQKAAVDARAAEAGWRETGRALQMMVGRLLGIGAGTEP